MQTLRPPSFAGMTRTGESMDNQHSSVNHSVNHLSKLQLLLIYSVCCLLGAITVTAVVAVVVVVVAAAVDVVTVVVVVVITVVVVVVVVAELERLVRGTWSKGATETTRSSSKRRGSANSSTSADIGSSNETVGAVDAALAGSKNTKSIAHDLEPAAASACGALGNGGGDSCWTEAGIQAMLHNFHTTLFNATTMASATVSTHTTATTATTASNRTANMITSQTIPSATTSVGASASTPATTTTTTTTSRSRAMHTGDASSGAIHVFESVQPKLLFRHHVQVINPLSLSLYLPPSYSFIVWLTGYLSDDYLTVRLLTTDTLTY